MVILFWFTTIGQPYCGKYSFKYLPISDSNSYDNTGQTYDVSRILTPQYTFDEAKYKEYSPLFLSTPFMLAYGLSFATMIAVLVHIAISPASLVRA